MKNLRIDNKLIDLISKNVKLSKKIASLALTTTLAAAPVVGNVRAESNNEKASTAITLVSQEAPTVL